MANGVNNLAANALPQEEIRVCVYLRRIIENKVHGVALTCIQAIVHWFLTTFSCFYPAYDRLYQQQDQLSRIKRFPDYTELRDLTAGKIARVVVDPLHLGRPVPAGGWPLLGYLTLNGLEIFGAQQGPEDPVYFTDRVTVEDGSSGQVVITEYEEDGTPHLTNIDVDHPFTINHRRTGVSQQMHVSEQAIRRRPDLFVRGRQITIFG